MDLIDYEASVLVFLSSHLHHFKYKIYQKNDIHLLHTAR